MKVVFFQLIEAWKFYAVIGALTAIDTVIALVWILYDPLKRTVKVFDEYVEDDVRFIPQMENCVSEKSQYVWIGNEKLKNVSTFLTPLFFLFPIFQALPIHLKDCC